MWNRNIWCRNNTICKTKILLFQISAWLVKVGRFLYICVCFSKVLIDIFRVQSVRIGLFLFSNHRHDYLAHLVKHLPFAPPSKPPDVCVANFVDALATDWQYLRQLRVAEILRKHSHGAPAQRCRTLGMRVIQNLCLH